MERIKRIRNPFQDRINALNLKDIDEGLKTDSYLKKSHDPIPNDINNERFPMTDILIPNTLKPEELSMKDLLDQIQIQTILNNNIAPFVDKKIKSEVTQEMIKKFQFESSRPVEINGKFYKYQPPGVDITLKDVPPPFPSEAEYKGTITSLYDKELKKGREIDRQRVILIENMKRIAAEYNRGIIDEDDYFAAQAQFDNLIQQVSDAASENEASLNNLDREYNSYDEFKLAHDTQVELITKENRQNLTNYEDELKSRNSGFEVGQQEGESDEDYAQRLIDTAQTTVDPAQVESQAKLFLYNSMKDLMLEVTPAYKAEAILNTIVQFGGYEKLQIIKDSWPSVKKLLVDTFGNVARVESTDNVAQLMYNYTMKPVIRPAGPSPTSTPLSTQPNIVASNVRPPFVYSETRVPNISAIGRSDIQVYAPVKKTPLYNQRGISTAPAGYGEEPRSLVPTPSAYPTLLRPDPRFVSPRASERSLAPELKTRARDILARMKEIPPEVGLPPPPLTQRSKSLEERLAGKSGRGLLQMTPRELREILEANGLPVSRIQKTNYDTVKEAGLLPPKLALISREEFEALGQSRMAQYLEDNQMRGPSGGVAVSKNGQPKPVGVLLSIFDRYKLTGSGFKSEHIRNIKDEFAIVDGEIQAGNNNPALMRDARKMLKEMVQKKMITLYEAQCHMKHLRKINKI